MRGLAMDFREDEDVYDISDQFMFGPAFLVNPVIEPFGENPAPARDVYLPEAPGWFDFWTGEKLGGGRTINAPAPLSIMPLFIKAGSIVPLGPFIQYATEKSDPVELRVYPGADARFTLYEDENDNYNYETGVYSTIEFIWDDSSQKLSIGESKGRYPGMPETRTFNIVLVAPGRGVGEQVTKAPDKVVKYHGRAIVVGFD